MAIEAAGGEGRRSNRVTAAVQYLAGWTAVAALFAANAIVVYSIQLRRRPDFAALAYGPRQWLDNFAMSLADWYLWALLAPVVVWLGRRVRIERPHWFAAVLAHVVLSIGVAGLKVAIRFWIGQHVSWLPTLPALPGNLATLPINLAAYWAILGISYAFEYHRRYRDREVEAARLESRLAQAQLHALQAQLQPHFLFNTLHSISVLIREKENDAADSMLTRLSDLLRLSLEAVGRQEQSLANELEFVARYVAIQQIRFQDRLVVHTTVDPNAIDALVPTLVLQPLVENAILHGIAPQVNGGRVEIVATVERGELLVTVRDDGPGMSEGKSSSNGVGLTNTQARLEQLYGSAQRFDIRNRSPHGVSVELRIPYRQS